MSSGNEMDDTRNDVPEFPNKRLKIDDSGSGGSANENPQVNVNPEQEDEPDQIPIAELREELIDSIAVLLHELTNRVKTLEENLTKVSEWIATRSNKQEIAGNSMNGRPKQVYKLPEVPAFSGQFKDYVSWNTSFQTLILDQEYPEKLKFEAFKKCIRNLPILSYMMSWQGTAEDMEAALAKLRKLFGNEGKIGRALLEELQKLPSVRELDHAGIQHLATAFHAAVQTGERNKNIAAFESQLRDTVLAKVPLQVRMIIAQLPGTVKTLEQIQEVLDSTVDAYEDYSRICPTTSDKYAKPSFKSSNAHAKRISTQQPQTCPYDGEKHQLRVCPMPYAQRMVVIEQKKLCRRCLKTGHESYDCKTGFPCYFCKGSHHSYACEKMSESRNVFTSTINADGTCFKTTVIQVNNCKARLLFDQGSGTDFITTALVQRLNLDIETGPRLNIYGFGRDNCTISSSYVTLDLTKESDELRLTLCVVPSIGNNCYPVPGDDIIKLLEPKSLEDYTDEPSLPVEIIIGLTSSQRLLNQESIISREGEKIYSKQQSRFGTIVFGGQVNVTHVQVKIVSAEEKLLNEVEASEHEEKDDFVEKFVKEQVQIVDGRVQVTVPVTGAYKLTSNAGKCLGRLRSSLKQWSATERRQVVVDILNEWLAMGIIEPAMEHSSRVRYMSYHVVSRPESETTKHRLVFDGSLVDDNGRSLNDYLFKGETSWNLLQSLVRFRSYEFPILGDISKAFLMVEIHPKDRDLFRFFWPDTERKLSYRFKRVPFGTSASPFLLFAALKKIGSQLEGTRFDDLFYVDDLVYSFQTKPERDQLRNRCEELLNRHGFKINWKDSAEVKVLGIRWSRQLDEMSVRIPDLTEPENLRELSSLIARLFDPLGMLEPVSSALRRLFSRIWKTKRDWDGKIESEDKPDLRDCIAFLEIAKTLKFKRWVGWQTVTDQYVHIICDANLQSIGTAIYVESQIDSQLNLLYSKSLLHANRSIAEAELDAIILGINTITRLFTGPPPRYWVWTDSQLNYRRLKMRSVNLLDYKQARKVMKLHETVANMKVNVGFLPGKENPADKLTKFNSRQFRWIEWITRPKPDTQSSVVLIKSVGVNPAEMNDYSEVCGDINAEETLTALVKKHSLERLIKADQAEYWNTEIEALNGHRTLPKKSTLGPYYYRLEGGVLVTKVRTDAHSYRTVLERDSKLTALILHDIHVARAHAGTKTITSLYCDKYFTPGVRRLVHTIISQCETCKRLRGKPTRPTLGPLPTVQTTIPNHAFQRIGVDFAGPLNTEDGPRYVIVVTCLNSRAVFLKLLATQTAHSIICSLRILGSTYGIPAFVYSDNANVFCKSGSFLKKLYSELPTAMGELNWKYSFPGYPQSNGMTEIMVGITKRTLKALTFGKRYSSLELEVFLAEASAIINNRPLLVTDGQVITPAHLIFGRETNVIPNILIPSHGTLGDTYSVIRKRVHGFWKAWKAEYFLHRRHQQIGQLPAQMQVGDLVLYEPFNQGDKSKWPTAEVIKTHPGPDEQIRLVDLKLDGGKVLERRPVGRLVPLESNVGGGDAVASSRITEEFQTND